MAWRKSFQPLRVTAQLRTAVVADRWLPLDGILLYQACRERLGPEQATLPGGGRVPRGISMPLLIVHPGERDWYYACSWAQPQPWWSAEGLDHWNKRFRTGFADLVDFAGRRGKVIVEKGRYRAHHAPIVYRAAAEVQWYCVGDRRAIEALLSTVTHIGKKTAQGWGRVITWQIEPWAEDWSVWRDDRLMRGIPVADATGRGAFAIAHYGLRPSYYRRVNQRVLAMPQ